MSDNPPGDDQPDVPAEESVPVDEFCRDLSMSDSRVELIGAFRHIEMNEGRHHDTPTEYKKRYDLIGRVRT